MGGGNGGREGAKEHPEMQENQGSRVVEANRDGRLLKERMESSGCCSEIEGKTPGSKEENINLDQRRKCGLTANHRK